MANVVLSPAATWQLEFVRLIAFPANAATFLDQQWWQDLTGDRPAHSSPEGNGRDDRGSFEGVLLALTADPQRIVWEARSLATIDRSGTFPTLGPFRDKVDWFVQLMKPWLATMCPPLVRLAFSAKLLHLAANAKEAYAVLGACLPIMNLQANPNDFLLQINTRKDSSVIGDWPINRVRSWSKMNVAIAVEPGKPFTWPDRCYSVLELDMNTATERGEVLPQPSLPLIFEELATLGREVAEQGETP